MDHRHHRTRIALLGGLIAALAAAIGCGSSTNSGQADRRAGKDVSTTATATGTATGTATASSANPGTVANQGAAGASGQPTLMFLGGYSSCRQSPDGRNDPTTTAMATILKSATAAVKTATGRDPLTVLGCYGFDPAVVTYLVSGAGSGKVIEEAPDTMIANVGQLLAGLGSSRVFLVGHSYGGWTAMESVLKLDSRSKVVGLITLDPISRTNCTPAEFLSTGRGCLEAPADFGATGLSAIAQRSGYWGNYYQTASPVLHSGPITGAQNVLEPYSTDGVAAHNQFLADQTVIGLLLTAVTGAFK